MRRTVSKRVIGVMGCLLVAAVLALSLAGPSDAAQCQFPATGQTTCWDSAGNVIPCAGTGQDGDIQAGKTLRYKDNGDGTITDKVTGLIWEKNSTDGSIHSIDFIHIISYWFQAFGHVDDLNAMNFAGHDDWRLPNVKELQSIIDYEKIFPVPAIDPAFNNNCTPGSTVLTGSCTASWPYWSSSTDASDPSVAWVVDFFYGGRVDGLPKLLLGDPVGFVRAVRGGCVN